MPVITPLPRPPSSTDPSNFATRADAYLVAQNAMVTELNNAFNQIALNIIPGGATPGILSTTGVATFEVVASGYNAFSTTRAHGSAVFPVVELERSRGTSASPTAVQTGDTLGAVAFVGRDSAGAYSSGARVMAYVSGTVTSGCVPTGIGFDTTPPGGVQTRRLEISPSGAVTVLSSINTPVFGVEGDGYSSFINQRTFGTGLAPAFNFTAARGTRASPTASANNDVLGTIVFNGYDGSNYIGGAFVQARVSGAVSSGVLPTYLGIGINGTDRIAIANTGIVTLSSLASIATTGNPANVYSDTSGTIYRNTSSLRYKEGVEDYAPSVSIDALRPVTFFNKADKARAEEAGKTPKRSVGFIAEEMDEAGLAEFVAYDEEGLPDAVHYATMVALLTYELQQLRARVAALEAA